MKRITHKRLKRAHRKNSGIEIKYIIIVKKTIKNDWKDLGRYIGFEEEELRNLQQNRSNETEDIDELAYKMLQTWSSKKSISPSVEKLLEALRSIDREDIAEKIELSMSSNKIHAFETKHKVDQNRQFPLIHTSSSSPRGVVGYARERRQKDYKVVSLKNALTSYYVLQTIPCLPWIECKEPVPLTCFVTPNLEMIWSTGNIETFTRIPSFNDLLNELADAGSMVRILIEGPAGCGKTTFATKVCYDWSQRLLHFDVVLFLPLRKFAGNFDNLVELAPGVTGNHLDILAVIGDKSRSILIIFDGYDEVVDPQYQQELISLFKCDILSHVSIVVTSRNLTLCKNVTDFWSHKIKITEMDLHQQKEFVDCYAFKCDVNSSNIEYLQNKDVQSSEIPKYPLSFLMALFLPNEMLKGLRVMSMTELYKLTYEFITINSRNQSCPSSRVLPNSVDQMFELGEVALDAIANKESFVALDLKKFYDAGFFNQYFTEDTFFDDRMHEPLHLSFVEYAAEYARSKKYP